MKNFHYIFLLLLPLQSFAQKSVDKLLQQYNTRNVPYISVEGLRALQINEEVIIFDTREDTEYAVSKINGASCVGYTNFSVEKISAEIEDKEQPIVVYCSLGIRSETIGEKLLKAGFTNVKNLYGGIFEWKNKGYPIVNDLEKETDSVHTFSKAWSKWLVKGVPVHTIENKEKRAKNIEN